MKRFAISMFVFVIIGVTIYMIWMPSPSFPIINFRIQPDLSTNDNPQTCIVVLSNTVDTIVLYPASKPGGYGHPLMDISYMTNNVWGDSYGTSISACMMEIHPHQSLRCQIKLPEKTTRFKLGLYVTELTWRGELGLLVAASSTNCIRAYISDVLISLDSRQRSRSEWSGEFELNSTHQP